jgi:fructosamine-3-kinase
VDIVSEVLGVSASKIELQRVQGGDIHAAYCAAVENQQVFVKANSKEFAEVLETEYESLRYMQAARLDFYPQALHIASGDEYAVLMMQHYPLSPLTQSSAADLGRQLARQHLVSNDCFGWIADNFIGLTRQINSNTAEWGDFFRQARLQPQLELAINNGLSSRIVEQVVETLGRTNELLGQQQVKPALLHGDLWSGNVGFDTALARTMMFDPAPYFGDPESDLAMTELFGRFPAEFYTAYHATFPRREGYSQRRNIYQLYHALNHFNLFGAGYESMIKGFCTNFLSAAEETIVV